MTYFQIDGLLIITNKNATKTPGHQSQKFGTPRLIINTLTLVEFGAFVFWWQKELFKVSNLKYDIASFILL